MDELYYYRLGMKRGGGGSGGGGDEADRVEVLAKCQPPFDDSYGYFILQNQCQLEIGKNYIVDWNGTEYTGTVIDGSPEGFGDNSAVLVNDGADKETGEGTVFIITYTKFPTGDDEIHIIDPSGSDSLTIAIYQVAGGGGNTGGGGEEWIGDGNTHIWISLSEGRTSPTFYCAPNGTVTIDWGDGTDADTLTGTSVSSNKSMGHTYAEPGEYVLTLVVDGSVYLTEHCLVYSGSSGPTQNKAYYNAVRKVECGNGVTGLKQAFDSCSSLEAVYFTEQVTSFGDYTFQNCYSLKSVEIPNGATNLGRYLFNKCYSLRSVILPSGLTALGDSVFGDCYALADVGIPDGVAEIPNSAFKNCFSLTHITIPNSVGSIGSNAFYQCGSLAYIRFTTSVPPSVGNSGAFNGIPTDCVIYVPKGSLEAYTTATNYPSSATYTYVEEE